MKNIFSFLLFNLFFIYTHAQKPLIGVDLGYQIGNFQYFETGLNVSMKLKNSLVGELSLGIEDDLNSSLIGYKTGLMFYDGLGISTESPNAKPIPLLAGINVISYKISNESAIAFRPEVGIRGIYRHGSGRTIAKISYGYNIIDSKFENQVNKHLLRISLNTNWRALVDLFSMIIY